MHNRPDPGFAALVASSLWRLWDGVELVSRTRSYTLDRVKRPREPRVCDRLCDLPTTLVVLVVVALLVMAVVVEFTYLGMVKTSSQAKVLLQDQEISASDGLKLLVKTWYRSTDIVAIIRNEDPGSQALPRDPASFTEAQWKTMEAYVCKNQQVAFTSEETSSEKVT